MNFIATKYSFKESENFNLEKKRRKKEEILYEKSFISFCHKKIKTKLLIK